MDIKNIKEEELEQAVLDRMFSGLRSVDLQDYGTARWAISETFKTINELLKEES